MVLIGSNRYRSKSSLGYSQEDLVLADDRGSQPRSRCGYHYGAMDFKVGTRIHNLSVLRFRWRCDSRTFTAHGEAKSISGVKCVAPNIPTPQKSVPRQGNSWSHPLTRPTCQQWNNWGKADAYIASGAALVSNK